MESRPEDKFLVYKCMRVFMKVKGQQKYCEIFDYTTLKCVEKTKDLVKIDYVTFKIEYNTSMLSVNE